MWNPGPPQGWLSAPPDLPEPVNLALRPIVETRSTTAEQQELVEHIRQVCAEVRHTCQVRLAIAVVVGGGAVLTAGSIISAAGEVFR